METQHTPGPPFTRSQVNLRYYNQILAGETKMDFANWLMDEVNATEFERWELLEALRICSDLSDELSEVCTVAKAAIAKAEGGSP